MSDERFCPDGQHWQPLDAFTHDRKGRTSRNCIACMAKKRPPWSVPLDAPAPPHYVTRRAYPNYPGVDIDRIHYKLGAVAPHLRERRYQK